MSIDRYPLEVGIIVQDAAQLAAVYALLGGVSPAAIAASAPAPKVVADTATPIATAETEAESDSAPAADSGEIDAAGWPWSPELHASTKGVTKDGLWRMKIGVSRPAPKPGFPKDDASTGGTGTTNPGTATQAGATAASADAGEDEDEFAAFRSAADKANGADAAAAASIPARNWTDADLGALCNQAAVKLGDPEPVKEVIEQFVAEGVVPKSRNIAPENRAAFAKALEAKAGIEFAG